MTRFISALLVAFLLPCALVRAEEPKTPPKKAPKNAPKDPTQKPEPDDDAARLHANRYTLPEDADSTALVEFIESLQDFEPEDDHESAIHDRKMPRAIKRACRRILELEKDKEAPHARFARRMTLAMRLDASPEFDSASTDMLLDRVQEFLASPSLNSEDADVANALADFLGQNPQPKAIALSRKIGTALSKNIIIPEITDAGKLLLGIAKRLDLVGKPLTLKGTTLDGKPFDLAQLKDKVVLVDFWATWCGHCVGDIPHLKRCREAFGAKGFEIVAISADEERTELTEFLATQKLPWINLYENNGKHPALDEFGITAFPSSMLVGKDGLVVALDLRDEELTNELKKLLGDPAPGINLNPKEESPEKNRGAKKKPLTYELPEEEPDPSKKNKF
ncbi:MAG: TlpA disulfide reductase family protein [Planctomycetota bacterium]